MHVKRLRVRKDARLVLRTSGNLGGAIMFPPWRNKAGDIRRGFIFCHNACTTSGRKKKEENGSKEKSPKVGVPSGMGLTSSKAMDVSCGRGR